MTKRTDQLELPEAIEFVGPLIFPKWTGHRTGSAQKNNVRLVRKGRERLRLLLLHTPRSTVAHRQPCLAVSPRVSRQRLSRPESTAKVLKKLARPRGV